MPATSSAAQTNHHGGLRGRGSLSKFSELTLDVSLGAERAPNDTFFRSSVPTTIKNWHLKEMSCNFIGCNGPERVRTGCKSFQKHSHL